MSNYIDEVSAEIAARCGMDMEIRSQRDLARHYAVLCRAKGRDTTSEDVHDAWSAWCSERDPDHRSLVPFGALSRQMREMDRVSRDAIRAVASGD